MKTEFEFNTKAKANKFAKTLRKSFILTECMSNHTVKIWNFEGVKDERKEYVLAVAERVASYLPMVDIKRFGTDAICSDSLWGITK